jgi:hypothetical protein
MTTESVLKHLTWVGPLCLYGLAYGLKYLRLYVLRLKAARAAGGVPPAPVPPPAVPPPAEDQPPAPPVGPPDVPLYIVQKSPEQLQGEAIQLRMAQAMADDVDVVSFVDDTPVPGRSLTGRVMSPLEVEQRIAGYNLYRERLAVEARAVTNPQAEALRAWAENTARTQFLTAEKIAELRAEAKADLTALSPETYAATYGSRPEDEVMTDLTGRRAEAYVKDCGTAAVALYHRHGMTADGIVKGNMFAYKMDGSAAPPPKAR